MTVVLNCDSCGLCCREDCMLPLTGNQDDGALLPPVLALPLLKLRNVEANGCTDCVWLDLATLRCIHYEYRPSACRAFKMGGPDCVRIRKEAGIVGVNV